MEKPVFKDLTLARNLPLVMRRQGISVKELASLSGVSHKNIYEWMAGRVPGLVLLYKVAQALETSIEELAFGKSITNPTSKPEVNSSFELVLYKTDENQIRQKLFQYSSESGGK